MHGFHGFWNSIGRLRDWRRFDLRSVAAIRAEVRGISVEFASIGLGHSVPMLFRQVSELTLEP